MSSVDFNILNIEMLLQERRLSKTTASFLSKEHDPVMLRQISTMEIDLSEDDDWNIQGQLNDERLSMMTASSWSISSTKHDRETMDSIRRELSMKRVSETTADFLTTEHDPKILRQISTMEVDIGLDGSLRCPGLDTSNVSRDVFDEHDEDEYDSDEYESDEVKSDEKTVVVHEKKDPQVKIRLELSVIDAVTIGLLLGSVGCVTWPYIANLLQECFQGVMICILALILAFAATIGFVFGFVGYVTWCCQSLICTLAIILAWKCIGSKSMMAAAVFGFVLGLVQNSEQVWH